MATADVNPTEGPARNKLEDKLITLREVIDRNKSVVVRVCEEMKQLIDEKSQQIIIQLEVIWDEAYKCLNQKREEIDINIKRINKYQRKMKAVFASLHPTLPIETVRREVNIDVPYVKLSWRLHELRKCIEEMCVCEDRVVKFGDYIPIALQWSCCHKSKLEDQLFSPRGLSTDCISDRIYVCDLSGDRVQIFSGNGQWIKCLEDELLVQPENIITVHDSMFVQCSSRILKFNTFTFKRESHITLHLLFGICTDNSHIFVRDFSYMKLMMLSLELKEEKTISLITDYKRNRTEIQDLSFARNEFYVLLSGTEYPIQSFSEQGSLTRCIISRDMLSKDVRFFCLDQQLNIFIADTNPSRVKIFSNDGKLITQIGKGGTAEGDLDFLQGIAVNELCSIITVDWKQHNMLQTFSYN